VSKKNTDPGPDAPEGWESLEEEAEGALGPNPELEEAMREAMEAVEAREEERRGPTEPGAEGPSEEVAALQDRLLRLQADFENFRKRTLKEKEEAWRYGHQNLVKDLLATVDNLERAIEHARGSEGGDLEGLLQGVELVLRELLGILGQHGLAEIDAEGEPFDPAFHEAMAQQPDDSVPPNTVVQVYEKGYRLRDRMLRPARVVVSGAPEQGEKSEDEEG
jgi:molecular chaperone GrpE